MNLLHLALESRVAKLERDVRELRKDFALFLEKAEQAIGELEEIVNRGEFRKPDPGDPDGR